MARYLCIVRLPAAGPFPADSERAAALDDLRRGGHLVAAFVPGPAGAGVVVRVRAGHLSVALDAAAEAAAIDAVFVLDARDLNEAIHLAAREPGARHGVVEVRPLQASG